MLLVTSPQASRSGDLRGGSDHLPMPLMPVSPPSAAVEVLASPVADSRGGSGPSSVLQGSPQASPWKASVERAWLSSLQALSQSWIWVLGKVSPQALLPVLLKVSPALISVAKTSRLTWRT